MDPTVYDVLVGLEQLAGRNGWTQISAGAQRLAQEESAGRITVAVPAAAATDVFRNWLADTAPGLEKAIVPLPGLLADPRPGFEADRLVALLPCGHLLTGEEIDAVEQVFFCRPAGTYAFVLTEAEEVEDAEDLDLVERGAWRLLVPEPKPDWNHQELLAHHCYLWTMPPAGFAAGRVAADMDALQSWMNAPPVDATPLRRTQLLALLNQAREGVERSAVPVAAPEGFTDHQLRDAHERVIELRRRWTRRLDADASSIERQLVTSLQTLELEMQRQLGEYLEAELRRREVRSSAELKALLTHFISSRAQQWHHSTRELLKRRQAEITADTEALLGGVDWTVINGVLARQGSTIRYPEALWTNLAVPADLGSVAGALGEPGETPYQPPSQSASRVRMAATGAVVSTVAMFLLGIGALGVLAGGAGAAVGGVVLSDKIQRGQVQQQCEEYGRRAIREVIAEANRRVRLETPQRFHLVRSSIRGDLELLERVLHDALLELRRGGTAGGSPAAPTGNDALSEQLDDYVRRLTFPPADRVTDA